MKITKEETRELLQELGWERNDSGDWCYPSKENVRSKIYNFNEGSHEIKDIVRLMLFGRQSSLMEKIIQIIEEGEL